MTIITLDRLANLPTAAMLATVCKTDAEAEAWAGSHGAETVTVYHHLTGGITAWILKEEK